MSISNFGANDLKLDPRLGYWHIPLPFPPSPSLILTKIFFLGLSLQTPLTHLIYVAWFLPRAKLLLFFTIHFIDPKLSHSYILFRVGTVVIVRRYVSCVPSVTSLWRGYTCGVRVVHMGATCNMWRNGSRITLSVLLGVDISASILDICCVFCSPQFPINFIPEIRCELSSSLILSWKF